MLERERRAIEKLQRKQMKEIEKCIQMKMQEAKIQNEEKERKKKV